MVGDRLDSLKSETRCAQVKFWSLVSSLWSPVPGLWSEAKPLRLIVRRLGGLRRSTGRRVRGATAPLHLLQLLRSWRDEFD